MLTEMIPEIYETNVILSRLTEKPVTVEIGKTGVTIDLNYYGWPTLVRDENGVLYVAASLRRNHVDPFGATAFFESHDGGLTWSEPRIIYDSPVDDRDTGLVYIGGGKMVATFFTIGANSFLSGGSYEKQWGKCTDEQKAAKKAEWETYSAAELTSFEGKFVLLSEDYGKTWSDPIRVPFSCPHGPSLMNDGRTLIVSGISSEKIFQTYISRDFGKTWSKNSEVQLPELPEKYKYSEPYVIQLKDGSYLAGIRSGIGGSSDGSILGFWVMKSQDGKNWTEAKKIESVVGAPPHFLELSNGAILMTYSYRLGNRGIRGCLSYDGGETWTEELIVLADNVSTKNKDLGYPTTVEMDDGTLVTVYYQPSGDDWCASVLYTKWRLNSAE